MFEKYDPRQGKMLTLLNEKGLLEKNTGHLPLMDDQTALQAYDAMVQTREADLWAVSLNRQGRMPTYPPVLGQEANSIGTALAVHDDDWYVQAFREMGGLIIRKVPLARQYLFWLGNEKASSLKIDDYHILPVSVPIASQYPHAVGLAFAEKVKKTGRIAIAFVGDGGTSEGDFHEALNFAAVWKAPVIFYIQNNQWAISVPRSKQTASLTLAEKAFGYGFEGVQVDGNDVFAVYAATKMAAEKARKGDGPTLIEGYTYRMGAHTTADDPSRYREETEVKEWEAKDPLARLEKYLLDKSLIKKDEIEKLKKSAKKQAQEAFREAEAFKEPEMEDVFKYTFAEMPAILKDQMERRRILSLNAGLSEKTE